MTGLASVISGGVPVDRVYAQHYLGTDTYFRIPAPVYVTFVLFVIGAVFMTRTRAGVRLLSVGCNAEAVRRVGVNSNYYTTPGFVLVSLCAAIGGVVIAAFVTIKNVQPYWSTVFTAPAGQCAAALGAARTGSGRARPSDVPRDRAKTFYRSFLSAQRNPG